MTVLNTGGIEALVGRLAASVRNDSVFHAYIFEGAEEALKRRVALDFAKAILCDEGQGDACGRCISCRKAEHGNHEDILQIAPEGSSIKDEAIEWLQDQLKKKPLGGGRNIAIIDGADTMTLRAQNRILKTLEEPSGRNVIMLLCENAGTLTATIRSRCILQRIPGKAGVRISGQADPAGLAAMAEGMLNGRPLYEMFPYLTELAKGRDMALSSLDALETWFRDMLLLACGSTRGIVNDDCLKELGSEARLHKQTEIVSIIDHIEKAKKDLTMNINAGYALKGMLLGIQEDKDDKSCRRPV